MLFVADQSSGQSARRQRNNDFKDREEKRRERDDWLMRLIRLID